MTCAHYAGPVTRVFASLALLLCLGENLQAQTRQPVHVQTLPPTVARLTARQQHRLIRHNEAGAMKTMWTLFSAEATYQSTTGNGNYGSIEELGKQGLIDFVLAEGLADYAFVLDP